MIVEFLMMSFVIGYLSLGFLYLLKSEKLKFEGGADWTEPIKKEDYKNSAIWKWVEWETMYNYRMMPVLLLFLVFIFSFIIYLPYGWVPFVLTSIIFEYRILWWIQNKDGEKEIRPIF